MEHRKLQCMSALIVVCVYGSTVFGEVIRFDPVSQSLELGASTTTLTFDIYLESTSATTTFNSIDLLIGSNSATVSSFTFDVDFLALLDFSNNAQADQMANYNSAILAGGFSSTAQNRSVLIGTVTVDAVNLNSGAYSVAVSADTDLGISNVALGGVSEPLNGTATIMIFSPTSAACVADAECDDTLSCTTDACTSGICTHTPIDGCTDLPTPECVTVADCDDMLTCTTDACTGGSCTHTPIDGCTETTTPPGGGGTTDPGGDTTGGGQVPALCGTTGMIPLMFMWLGLMSLKIRKRFA